MEMIERYVYAVTRRLPQSQRNDIAKELRGLIGDMLEERAQGDAVTDKDVEAVLLDLGNPRSMAQKYRGSRGYLIGPEISLSLYRSTIKTVLISIVVGLSVVFAISSYSLNPLSVLDHFVSYIVSLVTVVPQGFGWTTFVFFCIDYFGGVSARDLKLNQKWKPADLPPIPDPKRRNQAVRTHCGHCVLCVINRVVYVLQSTFGCSCI